MKKEPVKKINKEKKEEKEVKKEIKKIVKPKKKVVVQKKEKVIVEKKKEVVLETENKNQDHYFESIGRRKTAIARVRLYSQGDKTFLVNEKPFEKYFSSIELQQIIMSPLEKMNCLEKFKISVVSRGGGTHAQAEAVRHGISRALILFNPTFKKRLKSAGFLTRDSRSRERKKFGLKRARRAPQWSKR